MRLIIYGTLRKGARNFSKLPPGANITTPGATLGDGEIIVDIWEKDLNWFQRRWLLFKLDILEAIYLKLYQRVRVPTHTGDAWMYLYLRDVDDKKQITDWLAYRHA